MFHTDRAAKKGVRITFPTTLFKQKMQVFRIGVSEKNAVSAGLRKPAEHTTEGDPKTALNIN